MPNLYQVLQNYVFKRIFNDLNRKENPKLNKYYLYSLPTDKEKNNILISKRSADYFMDSNDNNLSFPVRPLLPLPIKKPHYTNAPNNSNHVYHFGIFLFFPLILFIFLIKKF